MNGHRSTPRTETPTTSRWFARLAWYAIVVSVVLIPCLVTTTGKDAMRLPKDLTFIGVGILLAAILTIAFASTRSLPSSLTFRTVPTLAIVVTGWTAITSVISSNRTISVESLLWVACAAVFVCAIDWLAQRRSPMILGWLLVPAVINAVIFLFQRFHIWNPINFPDSAPEHFRYTALIGNPDDVGSFFVAPAIAAAALFLTDRKRRVLWATATLLLLVSLGTGVLTSMVACGAGLLALGFRRSPRVGVLLSAALAAGALTLVVSFAPLRQRLAQVTSALRVHNYAEAFSGRVTPFLAAARMTADHPLIGVGPGCFRWEYYDYKLAVEANHPELARAFASMFNFGEVHNDHLQIAAESGLIGYAIFLGSLICLGAASFRRPDEVNRRTELARTLGFPLALSLAALCLAHFPLHLTAATVAFLYAATLCITWSGMAVLPVPPLKIGFRPASPAARVAWRAVTAVMAIAAIGFAIWAIRTQCYQPYACNGITQRAEQSTSGAFDAVGQYRAASIARASLEMILPCLERSAPRVDGYMIAAANYRTLGRLSDAAHMYRLALAHDRRPEIYYNLGLVELQLQQRTAAIADLLTAVRFSRVYMSDLPEDVKAELAELLRQKYPYLVGT